MNLPDNFVKKCKSFKQTNVGWISPEQDIIPVQVFEHVNNDIIFERYPEVKQLFDEMNEELVQGERNHINSIPEGEHPEWHVYECWAGSYKFKMYDKMYDILYSDGWVRIGHYSGYKKMEPKLVVEGKSYYIEYHEQLLNYISDQIGVTKIEKRPVK